MNEEMLESECIKINIYNPRSGASASFYAKADPSCYVKHGGVESGDKLSYYYAKKQNYQKVWSALTGKPGERAPYHISQKPKRMSLPWMLNGLRCHTDEGVSIHADFHEKHNIDVVEVCVRPEKVSSLCVRQKYIEDDENLPEGGFGFGNEVAMRCDLAQQRLKSVVSDFEIGLARAFIKELRIFTGELDREGNPGLGITRSTAELNQRLHELVAQARDAIDATVRVVPDAADDIEKGVMGIVHSAIEGGHVYGATLQDGGVVAVRRGTERGN